MKGRATRQAVIHRTAAGVAAAEAAEDPIPAAAKAVAVVEAAVRTAVEAVAVARMAEVIARRARYSKSLRRS